MKRLLVRYWQSILLLILIFVVIPSIWGNSYYLDTFNIVAIYTIVVMGLVLVSGYTGQISLGHNAFFCLGGYGAALMTVKLVLPPYVGLLAGLLGALMIGYMIAIASLRVRGYYLVITTLGLGWVVWSLTIAFPEITGGNDGIWNIPDLHLAGFLLKSNLHKYFLIWACTLTIFFLSRNIARSKVGRSLKAIHSNETLAEASGLHAARYKIQVMVYSALLASVAGFLMAHYRNEFGPPLIEPAVGIDFFIMMFLGGAGSIPGAFIGVGLMKLLPEFFEMLQAYKILAYGVIMIFVLMFLPEGLAGGLAVLTRRVLKSLGLVDLGERMAEAGMPQEIANLSSILSIDKSNVGNGSSPKPDIMVAEDLCKSFGGLVAVNNLSFFVKQGAIKAIIGPNGAGKSTVFNVISSILPADSGRNLFKGRNTVELRPFEVTALGLALTFQTPRLFDNLSVLENVMVGCDTRTKAGWLQGALPRSKTQKEERFVRETTLDLLAFVGLGSEANRRPEELPYAQKKLVNIARALATAPEVLCLDEPAGGLTEAEKEKLMGLIEDITRHGITILLVEHDMNFVMNLAHEVLVMNFGKKIADGTPQEVRSNDEVIKAYLGVED